MTRSSRSLAFAVVLAAGSAAGLCRGASGGVLEKALAGPLRDTEHIVFAVRASGTDPHWYANFGYWSSAPETMMYGPDGGRLCLLSLRTRAVTTLIDEPGGSIRDASVHYDGRHILFSMRRGGERTFHLYEIDVGGAGLRQVTSGPFDDIEATYLPTDEIAFCSSRCKRWVGCWHTQVAILHRAGRDGERVRAISSNNEHDNTPAVLPDGRLLYTRWEYVDRNQVTFHHLWTQNPDGTSSMAYFGNMHPGIVMIDARPIPGTDRVAAIFSPGHGANEHAGELTIIDPNAGPDARQFARRVPGCPPFVRDPYPLGDDLFLVARNHELLLVDAAAGRHEVLHALPDADRGRRLQINEPWPVRARPREPVVPDRVDWTRDAGTLVLQNVREGRRMDGVAEGEIAKLLVLEVLPKPANFSGGPDLLSWLGTFSLERVVGTVPVEPDGSATFELPAFRSFLFVALDAQDRSVKRMQSFVSVMPGEVTSCVGCHEHRTRTPAIARGRPAIGAVRRAPSPVTPIDGVPEVFDFTRDIQPILDRHCVACHTFEKRDGNVVLSGDQGVAFSHSYLSLFAWNQIADGGNGYGNRAPRTIGGSASALMRKLDGSHHGAQLSERERTMVRLWIETGATYAGTYAALGTDLGTDDRPVAAPPFAAAGDIVRRRCSACHALPGEPPGSKIALPATPQHGENYQRVVRPNDPVARRAMAVLFNFTRPEKSPLLLGPLAREAGGYGTCAPAAGGAASPVFADASDPDYQALLAAIRRTKEVLDRRPRFYMPGFVPNPHYIRELVRFGVLPPSFDPARERVDVYALDQAYWRSLWYRPESL